MVRDFLRSAVLAGFVASLAACFVSPAVAQSISGVIVPKVTMTDRNGVDLSGGTIITNGGTITIGPADSPVLSQKMLSTYSDDNVTPVFSNLRRDPCPTGPSNCWGYKPEINVRLGSRALVVGWAGDCRGDCDFRLQYVAPYYVLSENTGTQWAFDNNPVADGGPSPATQTVGWLREIRYKNGEVLTYNYEGTEVRSITSNLGYQINYNPSTVLGSPSYQLTNLAYEFCDKFAKTCPNQVTNWPKATISGSNTNSQSVDALDRVSRYSVVPTSSIEELVTLTSPMGVARKIWRTSLIANAPRVLVRRYEDPAGWTNYTFNIGPDQFNSVAVMKVLSSSATRSSGGVTRFSMDDAALAAASNNTWTVGKAYTSILTDENLNKTILQFAQVKTSESALWLANQKIRKVIRSDGSTTTVSYDDRVRPSSTVETQKTNYGADTLSTSATFPVCTDWTLCSDPTSTTDARNNSTDYTYYEDTGLVKTATGPADEDNVRPQTRYRYEQRRAVFKDASGQPKPSVTAVWKLIETSTCRTKSSCAGEPDELKVVYEYDVNLLPIKETTSSGDGVLVSVVNKTYDPVGNLVSVDGPLPGTGDTTYSFYDAGRQLIGTIKPASPANLATRTTYNNDGQPTLIQRGTAAGVTRAALDTMTPIEELSIAYDSAGRKTREDKRAYAGATYTVTQYSYDDDNRLECTTVRMNPAVFGDIPVGACTPWTEGDQGPDRITRNVYDDAGQLLQVRKAVGTPLEQADATYSYTPSGKRKYVIDANGNRSKWDYDGFDRLSKWTFPATSRPSAYDPSTQVTALASAGAVNDGDYEEYLYDANGNRTSLRKRDNQTIVYSYDALNRMTLKNVPVGDDVYYGYDLMGLQRYARFGSKAGAGLANTYDAFGRAKSSSNNLDGTPRTLWYEYDAAGNRTQLKFPDEKVFTYEYDDLGRMTAIKEGGVTKIVTLTYDLMGRRKTVDEGVATTYGYDPIGRLSSLTHNLANDWRDVTFGFPAYNPASQVKEISVDKTDYVWRHGVTVDRLYTANGLNQYAKVGVAPFEYDANGNLKSDGSTTYGYDVENRLTSATGSSNLALSYDPTGRLWQTSGGGVGTTRFLYDGAALVGEYDDAGNLLRRFVHGPGVDEPLVWYEGSSLATRRLLRADRQGSVVVVTDAAGNSFAANSYDEYGLPAANNEGRFAYTGQIRIPELGMYYYKARIYSPSLGRFLQTDPIGYDDGLNWYAYVGNDPLNRSDPMGTTAFALPATWVVIGEGAGATAVGGFTAVAAPVVAFVGVLFMPSPLGDGTISGAQVSESRGGGNRLPPIGPPGTIQTNKPGTQQIKYGPDGRPVQEWNKGHPGYKPPEDKDHVHDHLPRPPQAPPGAPIRQPGRPIGPGDLTGPAPTPPPPPPPKPPVP